MGAANWNDLPISAGARGSEGDPVLADLEHRLGARITLEGRGGVAPFAITCGAYGLFVHTRFFDDEELARAALAAMSEELDRLLALECPDDQSRAAEAFLDRFP